MSQTDTEKPKKTIEQWATEKAVPDFIFAAAKAITPGWGVGREVDEGAFDVSIARVSTLNMRPA